jgi:hypothetical protein
MAFTTVSAGNKVTHFQEKVNRQYVRDGKFGPYIGASPNAIIQTNQEITKKSIPLIAKLSGVGVRGSTSLVGNEEALSNYDFVFEPTHVRNGVLIDNEEREKSQFDLFNEARPALMNWVMELKRDQIIQAMGAIQAGGTYYNYGGTEASGAKNSSAASAANLDTWQAANTDRILYGIARSNTTSGDHTTSLTTVDTTNDKMSTLMVSQLKRIAMQANPLIRPVMLNDDEPWFVLFLGSFAFRDLRADTAMVNANRDARPREGSTMKENPLFSGGDLMWDSVIIKEVPDLDRFIDSSAGGLWDGVWGSGSADNLRTAGASSSRVGVGFLCGAQAICFGRAKDAAFKERNEDDYNHLSGVGVVLKHDIKKMFFNGKQYGMVTSFHSAAVDS